MMISPNIYYETTMKGKSREDHLEEIRRVEADVRELEEIISRPGYIPSMFRMKEQSWNGTGNILRS